MTILFLGVTAQLLLLLLNACPVGFAMLIAGSIGILLAVGDGVAISVLRLTPHEHVASYTLSTLPMFVLMAELLTAARFTATLARPWARCAIVRPTACPPPAPTVMIWMVSTTRTASP